MPPHVGVSPRARDSLPVSAPASSSSVSPVAHDGGAAAADIIKIGDKWVSCAVWKKVHPGGAAIIERFSGRDATDAFMSLHSPEAIAQVTRMKSMPAPPPPDAIAAAGSTPVTEEFRRFRAQLVEEGWFEREWLADAAYLGVITTLAVIATLIAYSYPWLAAVLLGISMQQAGWVGHDHIHGRGKNCYVLGRAVGGLFNGFSAAWWSDKHNTHHVHTNQLGVDMDIQNDPLLHLWLPSPDQEFRFRRFQHFYYHVVYAALYVSWRIQSLQFSWKHKLKMELFLQAINYAWLCSLPLKTSVGAVIFGGWLVAEIVTATHQSEEILTEASWNFCEDQFRTTRDIIIKSSVGNFLCGGMQFQLVHHLFPTMPRYYYPSLRPRIAEFARRVGIEYRTSSFSEILALNFSTMKKFAADAPAAPVKAPSKARKVD